MSQSPGQKRAGLIANLVLATITVGLLVLSAWLFWVDQRVFVLGEQAQAVVLGKREVRMTSRTGSGYSKEYHVRYRFQPEGQATVYSKQSVSLALFERLQAGDRTPVWFDGSDPERSYIDRRARWNAAICLLIGLGFGAGTAYSIRYQRQHA